ncbi:lipoyl(octanoyl) transferase LipB [Niveibacterium sp. SC-1]|uniref:lipoyl(octanoyl) transferase LipB n=1 Tax=Niveibacterium sp. SC-1 TaxID=3135646 RepID=UPI00311DF17F
MSPAVPLLVKHLGRVDYEPTWRAMQAFTASRSETTPDELWLVEHPPVYTLGLAGKPEHLIAETAVPVVKIDRGGQITYHGPGQAVVYLLVDIARRGIKVRGMVDLIEATLLDLLQEYGIAGALKDGAPGVYVDGAKIAALGLKISRGCSYHGLALNVDLDLAAFAAINPCGYPGLASTRLADFGVRDDVAAVHEKLAARLAAKLALATRPQAVAA